MSADDPSGPKRLHLKTYGCQMNVYDSERMAGALAADGYVLTDTAAEADLILLNTCHIREKAAEKVYSDIGRLRSLKDGNPGLRIGVTGCVAQAEGAEILRRAPAVDLVVGPQAYHRLPDLVARAKAGQRPIDTEFPVEDKFDHLPQPKTRRGPAAFLTVQEGCDKFCAFCVVPYTRGAEVSRPHGKLIAEVRDLVARGVREVTLLGQNVNAYRDAEGWSLARLIGALAGIEGLWRIRYTTSHPNDMGEDLIAAHGTEPKLMPWLHLPVQSGSDAVLRAMNRRHTVAQYLDTLARLRAARPDIAFSSDFITGFPGETEADFEATLDLVREVRYAIAYCFAYSPRPGTPAAGRDPVPEDVARDRLHRLQALVWEQQAEFQASWIGRRLPVLLEKPGREPGQMIGRSPWANAVVMQAGVERVGEMVEAEVLASLPNALDARLV